MATNNIITIKDGDSSKSAVEEAPSVTDMTIQKFDGVVKKKRRRGKSKRKVTKPYSKVPWQDRRRNDKSKRNNRFRKMVMAKTQAPFNNNQFLMEIHKPEPENSINILHTPARTRDSSFSVDSEENYFFSLPEDEEEYLTKEFSSVYEDAQSERLSNMTKNELIQEYLLLEVKYENLVKRTERSKMKCIDEDKDMTVADNDTIFVDKDGMNTEGDISSTSTGSGAVGEQSFGEFVHRMKEQEDQIHALQLENEKLRLENQQLRQHSHESSEDSESDSSSSSSSSSDCGSSSSQSANVATEPIVGIENVSNGNHINGQIEEADCSETTYPMVNGFHDSD